MKRYRVMRWDFDFRASWLAMEINNDWSDDIKESHLSTQDNIKRELMEEFGLRLFDTKLSNYIALGQKPISVIAFHNKFYKQIRMSFVIGAYYPALTASCALGERILNHLILSLRNEYKSTPEYKQIYQKDSFDNWDIPISVLESWGVLLPDAGKAFRELKDKRNDAIHFRLETDYHDRELALSAILCLKKIIDVQFMGFGLAPWFIEGARGETFIKKEWENNPFIKKVYLPNSFYVGHKHQIQSLQPQLVVNDNFEYENKEITDEEFINLRYFPKS